MFSPDKVLERTESPSNEIPLKELTYRRLEKQYEFIAASLPGLAQDLKRPLKILDVGTWRGDYVHFFTDLPEDVVESVVAIDINEQRIKQVQSLSVLQHDLASGRLAIMEGDGTNMPEFSDQTFDFINSTEILGGLKGRVPDLVSEVNRVLVFDGYTSFNIADQRSAYIYQQLGEFTAKKKVRYSKEELEEIVRNEFDSDVRMAWFGQMPIREDGENTLLPYKQSPKPDHIILAQDALRVQSVYSADGKKQFDPYFWMSMVRKRR